MAATFALLTLGFGVLSSYYHKKRRVHKSHGNFRRLIFGGVLFLSLVMLQIVTPVVRAGTYCIAFYGSRWYMVQDEISYAKYVVDNSEIWFGYAGYTCYDLYGSLTQEQVILDHATAFEQYFDHVAMFHHGHGGFDYIDDVKHWDYYDDDGPGNQANMIWDYEVYPRTWRSKHFFVIIWACRQGDPEGYPGGIDYKGRAVGMPFAWHHPVDPNYDCFIGFKDASMPLAQASKHNTLVKYGVWLLRFIYHAAYNHRRVIDALDQASLDHFGINFIQTELWQGFTANWPNIGTGTGKMKIYGNWYIYLY